MSSADGSCPDDYIDIHEVVLDGTLIPSPEVRYCGYIKTEPERRRWEKAGTSIRLVFRSNGRAGGRGFWLKFKANSELHVLV